MAPSRSRMLPEILNLFQHTNYLIIQPIVWTYYFYYYTTRLE